MPATAWSVRGPQVAGDPVDRAPSLDPDEPLLHAVAIAAARIAVTDEVDRLEIEDVSLSHCDVAGLIARDGRVTRLAVADCRIRGVTWVRGLFRDVTLSEITGADISLRFSTMQRVVIADSRLPGIDLTEVSFDRVRFERCDLRGAIFDHAKVTQLSFTGCNLAGATGVEALRGASMHPDDIASMSLSLATAVGIVAVED